MCNQWSLKQKLSGRLTVMSLKSIERIKVQHKPKESFYPSSQKKSENKYPEQLNLFNYYHRNRSVFDVLCRSI